jgi:Cys-rich protein (TIGR01571 family)
MTRMKLNWLAQPAPPTEWERTFRTLVYILIAVIVFNLLFGPPPPIQTPDGYVNMIETRPWSIVALSHIVNVGFSAYCLLLTWRLRSFVRFKYGIPEVRCLGCEDLCCSFWCGCCTLAQIARQTIDYDLEPAACCTTDGLIPMESRHAITI